LTDAAPGSRFRLTSIEATEVDEALLSLMESSPERLVPHIHAPLQSGSDRVLKRMGRHWYTASSYAESVERMAARLPVFGLGADIISGFPGESDDDHAATVGLVESLPFTYLHVFPYSARPGTAATRLDDVVPAAVARDRAAKLRAIGEKRAADYAQSRLGQPADVVVVGSGDRRRGLTEDYLDVGIADADLGRGDRVRMHLERLDDRSLIAVARASARAAMSAAAG
jgi:threonylcarbamoyladenosine tRNA methylthiotransferase MtaB